MKVDFSLFYYLVIFTSFVGIATTARFVVWSRSKAKRGAIDLCLLIAACLAGFLPFLLLAALLSQATDSMENALHTAVILIPLTATFLAQVAMFYAMGKTRLDA
jgi:hypothetical protein